MFAKKRTIPFKILQIEALLRRLPAHHKVQQQVKEDLHLRKAGFHGEKAVDYYLSDLPNNYIIINDLRLSIGKKFFQIDTLILTTKFFLIIEIKNISGTIQIDDLHKQLIRHGPNGEEGFPDPILQANRHKRNLRKVLEKSPFTALPPLEFFVVISKPTTIIKTSPNSKIHEFVIHASRIEEIVMNLERKFPDKSITHKQINNMKEFLIHNHEPLKTDILKTYGISKHEILTGVQCPNCKSYGMLRHKRKWYCKKCRHFSRKAHEQALEDYFLLIKSSINNKECREFLKIDSPNVAYKILNSYELTPNGKTHGKRYYRNFKD